MEVVQDKPMTKIHVGVQTAAIGCLVGGAALLGMSIATGGGFGIATARGWFYGWFFWMALTVGMVGLQMLQHTVRAKWAAPLQRVWEAGGGIPHLVLIAVGFLPIGFLFGPQIYEWMNPEIVAGDKMLQDKSAYLNVPFFWIRFVFYFAVWGFFVHRMQTWFRKEEETGDSQWALKRSYWAAPGLVAFCICVNFAMTDWGMSLDPHWFSTIYGVWIMVMMAGAALGFSIFIVGSQANKQPYSRLINPKLTTDIGHMLLAFVMIWAYFSLSQYLIIWSGNLPEFTGYYLDRMKNGFDILNVANIVFGFFVPFLLLLAPAVKRNPMSFALIGLYVFLFRISDFWFIYAPSLDKNATAVPTLAAFGSLLAFGGIWLLLFGMNLQKKPLLAESHPADAAAAKKEALSHA